MNPHQHYSARVTETQTLIKHVRKQITYISLLRVALFLAGVVGVIFFFNDESWKIILTTCLTFLPFLILVKIHDRLFRKRLWLETQERINTEELYAIEGNNEAFDDGKEFTDLEHFYSFDLDVFGRRSLFQSVNRTCTGFGKEQLAEWLKNHLTHKADIEKRQASVRALSRRPLFREQFRITGIINHGNSNDKENIQAWVDSPLRYLDSGWVKALVFGVPFINSLLLITSLVGIISSGWLELSFMFWLIISFGIVQRATSIQENYGKKLKTLNGYARLIALAKKEKWEDAGLNELIEGLNIEGRSPIEALTQLSKELDRLDLRNNQLLYVILEGTVFFQLQQIVRLERWKARYGHCVMNWLETVGEIDALCSLATFAYNHPAYTYPKISDVPFCFRATNMGHPLMPAEQCVKNDALIPSRPYFLIVTGANMAGKSTYLRTIGVNYLLACVGSPVCCESLTLYPAQLITSLRTSDSLSDNESYFFAELKRLKRIIDLLNEGKELFIILDEILKGTNSTDKQKGSFDLIRQFMALRANGIIATHDLLLGKLAEQFPEEIRNYCFEADIRNDELTFSYRIREGVAQNMNACFLMRKMGITVSD